MKQKQKNSETIAATENSRIPTRRLRCEHSASRQLPDGKKAPPGPRGACSKLSRTQGGEEL